MISTKVTLLNKNYRRNSLPMKELRLISF